MQQNESGYIARQADESGIGTGLTDVEVISVSGINIIARGRRFGRYWLLKGLIPELRESLSARRRLQKEFEIHSRLLHPNIVRAASFEEIPSFGSCIVEEWVEGETLASILRNGHLSKTERKRILKNILAAAGYMHSMGVVHRDLKPQNIMVRNEGGEGMIIDFGLADTDDYAELKQSAGTPGYISPEQSEQGGARITDDIYSLGMVMKELCPEYSKIANRCTAPLDRRPKDTSTLLRMIERADRRPKMVASAVVAALLAVVAVAVTLHVRSISAETADAQAQIDTLTNSSKRNAAKIAKLENELWLSAGRLETTKALVSSSSSDRGLRRRALVEAYRKIENEYESFDRERMHQFADNRQIFGDSIEALRARLDLIARQSYNLKRFPELARTDSAVLVGEVRNLYDQVFAVYMSYWHAQLERKRRQEEAP